MAGGGGASSRGAQARGRRKRQTPPLPLDILLEIAARSVDPATLVRYAATCRDMRRRAADESFRRRLRLRHTGGRFVLPLLRGHLTGPTYGRKDEQYMVDTAAAMATTRLTRLVFPPTPQGSPHETFEPLDSRGGLILLAVSDNSNHHYYQERIHLRVCDPATRHSHTFPFPYSDSSGRSSYVLLVGDGEGDGAAAGRPFQVLDAKLAFTSVLCLRIRIFSSEHADWGPCTTIPITPGLNTAGYAYDLATYSKSLVVGDVVHWLYLTPSGSHVITLHVGATTPRAKVTTLPASFPRAPVSRRYHDRGRIKHYSYLLATATPGGGPIVLVADDDKISAWPRYEGSKIWKQQPWTVVDSVGELPATTSSRSLRVSLECFAETSGAVLIKIYRRGFVWLDLQSKAIVRECLDPRLEHQNVYCSYEMPLSSWLPNFSSSR
ncbi:hypothetical protein HU200_050678 [Digitaria exilis]|uniref:F-box domain-containing protein n=1 Tax=Digitaria exilis TaxID=1010633 RepID=A0A835AX05_9POAL|nr:hypothetical protein HU200_050678 [Digitaria exilis]